MLASALDSLDNLLDTACGSPAGRQFARFNPLADTQFSRCNSGVSDGMDELGWIGQCPGVGAFLRRRDQFQQHGLSFPADGLHLGFFVCQS